jgi:hypothetical protein
MNGTIDISLPGVAERAQEAKRGPGLLAHRRGEGGGTRHRHRRR